MSREFGQIPRGPWADFVRESRSMRIVLKQGATYRNTSGWDERTLIGAFRESPEDFVRTFDYIGSEPLLRPFQYKRMRKEYFELFGKNILEVSGETIRMVLR